MEKNDSAIVKLEIIAYKDPACEEETGKFEALINPAQFTEDTSISYSEDQAKGTTGTQLQFDKITPGDFSVDLIFDSTGVLVNSKPEPVEDQIKKFKDVTMKYDGDAHDTYYLKLIWGTLFFTGRLASLKITYTVFRPDGTPLRAKATATFKHFKEEEFRTKEEGKKSPDLTHVRTVKAGDTLPLMTHRIYGDFSYYMEVARVNRLKNYRQLTPGMKLIFPPINKNMA